MVILYALTGLSLAVEAFHQPTGAVSVTPDYTQSVLVALLLLSDLLYFELISGRLKKVRTP